MMQAKHGVEINGIKPEAVWACIIVNDICKKYGVDFTQTSGTERVNGGRKKGSLHKVGFGFDVRTRNMGATEVLKIVQEFIDSLTAEFDVVLEADHIHIEFQP